MPAKTRETRRSLHGAEKSFQVERRGSRKFRDSIIEHVKSGANSPEPPHGGDMPGAQGPMHEAWLGAWEDRLRMQQECLEAQGIPFERSRASPVLNLTCNGCRRVISEQALQVYYVSSDEDLYSSNTPPNCVMKTGFIGNNTCGCRVQELDCECGMNVGYHMHDRCANCSADNDEDDDHRWLFIAASVTAEPRINPSTGVTEMWPGWDYPEQHTRLDETNDENCVMRLDGGKAGWNCSSPLADRNGRPKVELDQKELKARELEQGVREKFLRDATAEQDHQNRELAARSEDIAARETVLQNYQVDLEARERLLREQDLAFQQAIGAEEATKHALHRAEIKASSFEAEVVELREDLAEQRRVAIVAEEKLATQSEEVQQLHNALAEVRREVRKSVGGRGRLPSVDEAAAAPEQLKKRIHELEQELTADRVELSALRMEVKQAQSRMESKDAEIESLAASRPQRLQGTQKNSEFERLRQERDAVLKELERVLPELDRLRADATRTGAARPEARPDESVEARLSMAQKLAEKRMALDRREQFVVARETALQQGSGVAASQRFGPVPGAGDQRMQAPTFYGGGGGSGFPESTGILGLLERFGCARRQVVVCSGQVH